MFSGIVETIGTIHAITMVVDCLKIDITPHIPFNDLKVGDSIAVNGVCLTITHLSDNTFSATIVPESLRITNLSYLNKTCLVNLERPLKMQDRIGGHYVQGHVDAIGELIDLKKDGKQALLAKVCMRPSLSKYIVNKGYIALDGMSLTVIEAGLDWFTVTFVPHTQTLTIVKQYDIGTKINIEVDILSKYAEKLMRLQ